MTLLTEESTAPIDEAEKADEASTETDRPRWGRRILIGSGIATAALAVTVFAVSAPHLSEGTGDRTYHPTTFAEFDHEYSFGIGSLNVDLRDVDFPPQACM